MFAEVQGVTRSQDRIEHDGTRGPTDGEIVRVIGECIPGQATLLPKPALRLQTNAGNMAERTGQHGLLPAAFTFFFAPLDWFDSGVAKFWEAERYRSARLPVILHIGVFVPVLAGF